jgi:two-component system cell cycle sensor histidine kinase/response regulator CckA
VNTNIAVCLHNARPAQCDELVRQIQSSGCGLRLVDGPQDGRRGEVVVLSFGLETTTAEDLCRQWRVSAGALAPILVLGPWREPARIEALLAAGATDYLPSPCETWALQVRLLVLAAQLSEDAAWTGVRPLRQRLAELQHVEQLATVAGTLVHDFNNLLAAILGNVELALLDLAPGSPARLGVEQIEMATRRAAELAHQMLTYAGRGDTRLATLDLSELVEEMAELLRASIPRPCSIRYRFQRPLPHVRCDAARLRQVVMNLILNAADAMGAAGGIIDVRVAAAEGARGPEVVLEVRDAGEGIAPEVRGHIFDPFFTTKRTGRGLGLAAVLGIVEAHGGAIEVESEPGRGSLFRLRFPALPASEAEGASRQHSPEDWHTSGSILIVEDEPAVRDPVCRLLRATGFTVLEASSGAEGAELFLDCPADLLAVILDLNLPGLDGAELYRRMRQARPGVKILIWSGLGEFEVRQRLAGLTDPDAFLAKPSSIGELKAALRLALK